MLTQERQNLIENYVNKHQTCRVRELCRIMKTSESTIRRDLTQMEARGLVKRVHGGAQSVKDFSRDIAQHVRLGLNHQEKITIARYAGERFVHDGDYIFIDAGTTGYEMVPFIADRRDLTIVTNGIDTAQCCLNYGLSPILLGGQLKADTHAVIGPTAVRQLQAMSFTASFIGTNGLDQAGNLTTPDPEEAAIKRSGIARAAQAYVLTDKSKFGQQNFAVFENVQNVLVVTTELSAAERQQLPVQIKLEEAE